MALLPVQQFILSRWFAGLWLLILAFYSALGVATVPLHGDETTLIYMGRDYYYQFVERDLSKVTYAENPDTVQAGGATQQQLRLLNGTIPKYLFGFSAHITGHTIEDLNDQWDWGQNWAQNSARNGIPDDDILYPARLTSWVAFVIGIVGLFFVAQETGNRPIALLATFLYVVNPAVLMHGQRAMMDSFMLTGMIYVVWAGISVFKYSTGWAYVGLGVASGLALASKHTAVFTLIAVFGGLGALWLWRNLYKQQHTIALPKLMLSGILALAIFYAANPAWWGDPFERAREVLQERQTLLVGQIATFGGYDTFEEQVVGWLRQSFVVDPMYFEVTSWVESPEAVANISAYQTQWYAGISFGIVGGMILAMCSLAGVMASIHTLRQGDHTLWIMLVWGLFMVILTLFITPLEWQRYYLPMYPVIAYFSAMGLWTLARQLIHRFTLRH